MAYITVFTPTYNRAHTLTRAFESLQQQTVKDFEWLIIDDGSTDDTKNLVDEFAQKADFPIYYHWKENGGRHTAVNYSYQFLSTPYVVTCDSDDELVPDAIEKMVDTWKSLEEKGESRFWCITGREVDKKTGKMVGTPFPDNINALHGRKQRKEILKHPGEKHCCRKVDILVKHPFPEYDDTKFVSENQVWEVINREYDQYCVNDIYGAYYTDTPNSLSNSKRKFSTYRTYFHMGIFVINSLFDEIFFNRGVLRYIASVSRYAIVTKIPYKNVMRDINTWYKRALVTVFYPVSWIWVKFNINANTYDDNS